MNNHKQIKRYTVYNNNTDFPVIVSGTSRECANAMGVSLNYFWKCITGKHGKKWFIIKEDAEEESE